MFKIKKLFFFERCQISVMLCINHTRVRSLFVKFLQYLYIIRPKRNSCVMYRDIFVLFSDRFARLLLKIKTLQNCTVCCNKRNFKKYVLTIVIRFFSTNYIDDLIQLVLVFFSLNAHYVAKHLYLLIKMYLLIFIIFGN